MTTYGARMREHGPGCCVEEGFFNTPGPCYRSSLLLLALFAGWVTGCDLPGRPRPADRYVPPREERAFGALFQRNCAGCHGADGKLGPAPPLNNKLFLALVPDSELERVIGSGRAGTLMPAFAEAEGGSLAAEQVKVLAQGIKPRWGPALPVPSGAPPYLLTHPEPGSGGFGDKDQGAKVFGRACASCHGERGQGGRQAGAADGKTVGAINDPDFLALLSDQALRRTVIAGRPDLGTHDYHDPTGRPDGFQALSAQEVANITALLASWRGGGPANVKGE
jgi:mono/diheme cytochrome c family protein